MATQVFLLTDIEGSTRRWAEQPSEMQAALERHDGLVRSLIESAGGKVFKHTGDGLLSTFPSAVAAIEAAAAIQRALAAEDWGAVGELRVRIAIHAGEAEARGGDWFGPAVNRCARLLGVAHGGQVVVSDAARALTIDSPPPGIGLEDLGSHRLRDLLQPERVWQVMAVGLVAEFPPLRSLDAFSGNLPTQLTAFVGRELEVFELVLALAGHRLVTLVGAGGMGKTRLAVQVAAAAVDKFPQGAWLFELAPMVSAEAIDHTVALELGVEPRGDMTARDSVVRALKGWRALLVVDNCEHVVLEAGELISELLRRCPGVVILATSREPLHVPGERVWQVDPLDADSEAVELFADRASAARRTFVLAEDLRPVVARICRQLDGMPLAIELAAARLRSMSPTELAQRLDQRFRLLGGGRATGVPARHATLEAVVEWSYDLLTAKERLLLCRLSLFAGGFDLEAADTVCADQADDLATLDLLDALVERSLVVTEDHEGRTRYRLLETIRQFAAARVEPSEADELGRRHATYYASLVRATRHHVGVNDDQVRWEIDNLRTAVRFAVDRQDPELALAIVGPLWGYVTRHTAMVEPEAWAQAALALPGAEDLPDAVRAHILVAIIRNNMADAAGQVAHAQRALELERRLGLPPQPRVRLWLGIGALWQGHFDQSRRLAQEAAELAERRGRVTEQIEALFQLILVGAFANQPVDTMRINGAFALAEATQNPIALLSVSFAAGVAWARDDPSRAAGLFRQVQDYGGKAGIRNLEVGYAGAAELFLRYQHDPIQALGGLTEGLAYFRDAERAFGLRRIIRDFLPPFSALGRHETVAIIDAAAAPPTMRPGLAERAIEQAQRVLGEVGYQAAFSRGQAMSDDELEQYLLTELDQVTQSPG